MKQMVGLKHVQSALALQEAELDALGVRVPQVEGHRRQERPEEEVLGAQHLIPTYSDSKNQYAWEHWCWQDDPALQVRSSIDVFHTETYIW
jgi:hypothetical protein